MQGIYVVLPCKTNLRIYLRILEGAVNMCFGSTLFISEFGRIELSAKTKDFIANEMLAGDWKVILRRNLPDESEDEICYDNKCLCDRSCTVVRKLCEKGLVVCLSDMIGVRNLINKGVAKKAINKFQGPRVARVGK